MQDYLEKNEPVKMHTELPPVCGEIFLKRILQSNLSLKNSLIQDILDVLHAASLLDKEEEVWARLCIDELITNAIRHGNKENEEKSVTVTLFASDECWAIRVEDQGEGFSLSDIPDANSSDYWQSEHGRGIMLMQSYMDEIWYYNEGKSVQLIKKKKTYFQKLIHTILSFFKLK